MKVTIKAESKCKQTILEWIEQELAERTPETPDCIVDFWIATRNHLLGKKVPK